MCYDFVAISCSALGGTTPEEYHFMLRSTLMALAIACVLGCASYAQDAAAKPPIGCLSFTCRQSERCSSRSANGAAGSYTAAARDVAQHQRGADERARDYSEGCLPARGWRCCASTRIV